MNKKTNIIIAVCLCIAVGAVAYITANNNDTVATVSTKPTADQSIVVDMSAIPDNLESTIQKAIERQPLDNVIVLDVRTDQEWNTLHAKDALHWGLVEKLERGELPPLDKDTELYVYCRSGNRSGQAIKLLENVGYTNLTNIGGLTDWTAAGGATTSGPDTSTQATVGTN